MASSVKSVLACVGIGTSSDVSVLLHGFGFIRSRVPTDPDTSVRAEVSLLSHIQGIRGEHLNLNVIRVGFDARPASSFDDDLQKLDYAVYKTRNIYRQVNVGVGRVQHWFIDQADANGRDDIGSEDEAEALRDEWTVPNDGVDAFMVRNISASFVGISPVGGACDKDSKDDGLVAGEINRSYDEIGRTFAHELGHYFDLPHNHGDKPDCPDTTAGQNNLMAQTRCAISTRNSTLLTSGQGSTIRSHCLVKDDC